MVLVIMGVAGSGKTTVGELLARKLGWDFYDADRFHPEENVEKLRQGIPLTDEDRLPWLSLVRGFIAGLEAPAVIACSALKQSYRDYLKEGNREVEFIYLKGSFDLIRRRLEERKGHFAGVEILGGQFEALEEPENVLTEDVERDPETIAGDIIRKLGLMKSGG
jgi:gluconokinase